MNRYRSLLLYIVLLWCLPLGSWAQTSVQTTIPQPNYLYQCADSSLFTVKVKNTTATPFTNVIFDITMPTGIVKVGTATLKKGIFAVPVTDLPANTNSSILNFTTGTTLSVGDSLTLSYWAKALCNTANLSYTNTVRVTYSTGMTQVTTLAYSVQVPFLDLENAGTATTNISCADDQFTQIVRVKNNGNFNSYMPFVDIEITHPASVGIISTSIGTIITVAGKTVVRLSNTHFNTVGNNDNRFDFDEEIQITVTGKLLDCISLNQQVVFRPIYRCLWTDTAACRSVPETITHTLNVSSVDTPPTLTATTSCSLNSPTSSLTITNTGATLSQFMRLNLTVPVACQCQAIDFSTLTGSINGGAPFAIVPTSTTVTGSACLAGNPNNARAVTLTLPNLTATQVLVLNWSAPLCATAACNDASIYWQYELLYQSTCCPNTIRTVGTGSCTVQPLLSAVINPSCTNGVKTITITNTGNKTATDIAVRVLTGTGHLSGIVSGSVSASAGTLTFVSSLPANVCANPALLREANYTLNTLAAGASVTITFGIASCQTFESCTAYTSENYGYLVSYAQSCATGTLSLNGNVTTPENSLITDTDIELIRSRTCPAQNTYTLPLRISGTSLTYTQRYAEIVINLPANFAWDGVAAGLLLNGVTAPVSTTVVGNAMTVRYALPILTLPATINPTFTIDCTLACDGVVNINYRLNTYNNCAGNNMLLHTCNNTQFIDANTPLPNCPFPTGFGCVNPTSPTNTVRTNFGKDDFDNNRFADANNTMQASRLNKLLMYKDTLQTTYQGIIAGAPNSDTLITNIVLYQPLGGSYNYLTLYDLDFNITDISTGITYPLSNVYACANIASIRDTLSSRIYTLAFTLSAINTCYPALLPNTFNFEAGDIVNYTMKHRINSNLGLNVPRTLQVLTDMYLINLPALWQTPLPIFPGCPNVPADSVQVVGYDYQVTSQQTAADICRGSIDVTITHDFNIQATNNLNVFPFEDRTWVKFKTIKLTLPTGFTCNPATSVWTYTTPPQTLVLPVPPTTIVGNIITFDLTNYYTANNISVDDGNKLSIKITLQTLCSAQTSNNLIADYTYDTSLPLLTDLPAQAIFAINTNVPIINYNINNSPTSCTGTKATWSFSVSNDNASTINPLSAYYNWLHIEIPPASGFSNIVLLESGVTPITPDAPSGFYLLGDIPKGTTKTYTLTVDYANSNGAACYNNAIKLFYDWSCDAINTNFTTANFKTGYTCRYDSTQLSFNAGANTVLVDVLNNTYSDVNICENNTYVARIRNIGQNALRDVKITVAAPTGFSFVASSFKYSYNPLVSVPFTNGTVILPNFAVATFVDIEFQYTTTCLDNLSGNAQFIINIDVQTCCAGDAIAASPLPALDVSQIDKGEHKFGIVLAHTPELTCTNKTTTLTITITNTGNEASGNTDSMAITLPTGLTYKPNTITTNAGLIDDLDLTTVANKINWKLDPDNLNPIPVGGTRTFTLQLEDVTTVLTCNNFGIRVETFQQGIAACDALTPSLSCTRWRYTGGRNRNIRVQNTNFSIININQTGFAITAPPQNPSADITFRNNGPNVIQAGSIYQVKVYFDGVYTSTLSVTVPATILVGGTYTYSYTNIMCQTCLVKVELDDVLPNCICTQSEDEFWTGFPLNLPINLAATLNPQTHTLITWEASSDNIESYVLERSENISDFESIATITPETNMKKYSYIDKTVEAGKYYYRLRLINKQGQSTRSNIVSVTLPEKDNISLTVYPNPFEKDLTLKFSRIWVGELLITIYDISGKPVWVGKEEIDSHQITLINIHLPRGTYLLHATSNGTVWTKVIVR